MFKILLIEDDKTLIEMYQMILSDYGYQVETAENGLIGLKKVLELKPDLVLLDVIMPKMSGLDVLRKLKSDPQTKAIPIIILSNLSSQKQSEEALKMGALKYLIKSNLDPEDLVQTIKQVLG